MTKGADRTMIDYPDLYWYKRIFAEISDERFVFMNHGFANERSESFFSRLETQNLVQKYSMNLYNHVLSGAYIQNQSVLEVGCGRGGGCSFIARNLKPRRIVGLDLYDGNIVFCKKHTGVTI